MPFNHFFVFNEGICYCNFCDLLQAPAHLPSTVGVLVEEGPGTSQFLVKVNCRDRHGLLSDITQALRGLPLQVRLLLRFAGLRQG